MTSLTTHNTTVGVVTHKDEFTLVRRCPYSGNSTPLIGVTWLRGLNGPIFIEGGRARAYSELLRLAKKRGYKPTFA
jgi:hypothetical protein|tara:strand:+ start:193 stop:420 length:228 start_codon:yes stop_codon:yes gene_type:complete